MSFEANIQALGDTLQKSIQRKRVLITGDSLTSDYLLCNLVGLGVCNILQTNIDEKEESSLAKILSQNNNENSTCSALQQMYPSGQLEEKRGVPLHATHKDIHFIFDTSTDPLLQKYTYHFAQKENIPYIYCNTSNQEIKITTTATTELSNTKDKDIPPHIAGVAASIAAEKLLRHIQHPTRAITPFTFSIQESIYGKKRNEHLEQGTLQQEDAVIIGAGGIGTYTALALTLQPTYKRITIIDPKTAKGTNLNRQLLFCDALGESKAKILAQKLSTINQDTTYTGVYDYFTKSTTIPENAVLFCCTDNVESRLLASEVAHERRIELIEAGCSTQSMIISHYLPGKTQTVTTQRNLHNVLAMKRNDEQQTTTHVGCAEQTNPSVIMPNCMAGSLMPFFNKPVYFHNNSDEKEEVLLDTPIQYHGHFLFTRGDKR